MFIFFLFAIFITTPHLRVTITSFIKFSLICPTITFGSKKSVCEHVLWWVVGGREGCGTLACRLEEITADVRGRCYIFLSLLCHWLPRAAKFQSDLPIEFLQISAVQEACNPYAMNPRPLQFTCFISFVAFRLSRELFYLTLYLYTHTRD